MSRQGLFFQKRYREILVRVHLTTSVVNQLSPDHPLHESLRAFIRHLFPSAPKDLVEMASKEPDELGKRLGTVTLPEGDHVILEDHPLLPMSVLRDLTRSMWIWHRRTKGVEMALLLHVREPSPTTEHSPSNTMPNQEDLNSRLQTLPCVSSTTSKLSDRSDGVGRSPSEMASGESTPTPDNPQETASSMSADESGRPVLAPEDCILVWPKHYEASSTGLKYEMNDQFCPVCRICYPCQGEKCEKCGSPLEPLNLMIVAHSHGFLGAFFSSRDDGTSLPHIAFHMTVGNLDSLPSYTLSFCDGQRRYPLAIDALFDTGPSSIDDQTLRWLGFLEEDKKKSPVFPDEGELFVHHGVTTARGGSRVPQKRNSHPSQDRTRPKTHPQWVEEDEDDSSD